MTFQTRSSVMCAAQLMVVMAASGLGCPATFAQAAQPKHEGEPSHEKAIAVLICKGTAAASSKNSNPSPTAFDLQASSAASRYVQGFSDYTTSGLLPALLTCIDSGTRSPRGFTWALDSANGNDDGCTSSWRWSDAGDGTNALANLPGVTATTNHGVISVTSTHGTKPSISPWVAGAASITIHSEAIRRLQTPSRSADGQSQAAIAAPDMQFIIDLSALRRGVPGMFTNTSLSLAMNALGLSNLRAFGVHATLLPAPAKRTPPDTAQPVPSLLKVDCTFAARSDAADAVRMIYLTEQAWPKELKLIPAAAPWCAVVRCDLGGPGSTTFGGGLLAWTRMGQALNTAFLPAAQREEAELTTVRWYATNGSAVKRVLQSPGRWLLVWPKVTADAEARTSQLHIAAPIRAEVDAAQIAKALTDLGTAIGAERAEAELATWSVPLPLATGASRACVGLAKVGNTHLLCASLDLGKSSTDAPAAVIRQLAAELQELPTK